MDLLTNFFKLRRIILPRLFFCEGAVNAFNKYFYDVYFNSDKNQLPKTLSQPIYGIDEFDSVRV